MSTSIKYRRIGVGKLRVGIFAYALGILLAISFGVSGSLQAHPGRTDGSGGHYCRTNCPSWGYEYGEYHYHGYTEPEVDYYDQGYEYGSQNAIDNNRQIVISNAQLSGTEDGRVRGEEGEDAESFLSAPESVCEIDFNFRAGEYQDYIDGVTDGWSDSCRDIADEAYADAYSTAHEIAYAEYEQKLEMESNEQEIDTQPTASNQPLTGWFAVGALLLIYITVAKWQSIKEWFNS